MKNLSTILFLLAVNLFYAQSSRDTLNFETSNYLPNILSTNFDKQLNTYSSENDFIYGYKSSPFFVGINESYRSTITKTSTTLVKDEQYFSTLGQYNVNDYLSAGLLLKSNIYSDDRNLRINQTAIHNSSVFAKIKPLDFLSVSPFVGYSINKQIGQTDKGTLYGGEVLLKNLKFNEVELNSLYKYVNDDISPRKNTLRNGILKLKSNFENFTNSLNVRYMEQRKDFYIATDTLTQQYFNVTNNIQSRNESSYGIANRFLYNIPNTSSMLEINASFNWRDIERNTRYILTEKINSSSFDSRIKESRLNFDLSYRYNQKLINGFLRMQYTERQEFHSVIRIEGANEIFYNERTELEKQKNNISKQLTLTGVGNLRLSKDDRLLFSVLHRKLMYDTPSDFNFDDRDELLSLFRITYSKKINPFFLFDVNLEAALNHIVYIFAERSSNNNYKRFLKFSSSSQINTPSFKTNLIAEVSANYTVYDFEDLSPNFKSYSFRQLALRDSSSLRLNKFLYLTVDGYIKLSEQGDLKWNEFKTRPSRFLEEVYVLPMLNYQTGSFILGAGLRYYSLQTYKYDSSLEKIKDKLYNSIGPTSSISIVMNKLIFKLNGWYEFIRNEDNTRRELANISFDMNWNF